MRSKSIIVLLLVCVLASDCLAAWKIPLKREEVFNTNPKGKYPDDIIYTREILYGSDRLDRPQPTVFDTTSKFNWVISTECPRDDTVCFNEQNPSDLQPAKYECLPPCKIFPEYPIIQGMPVFGGRITFDDSKTSFDNIRFQEGDNIKTFTGIQSYLPTKINANSEKYLVKKPVRSSLGLGATDVNYNSSSFLNTVQSTVKVENTKFSFYFHKDLNQLRFGKEENFYRNGPFSVFKNRAKFNENPQTSYIPAAGKTIPENQWSLYISRITFNKPATDIPFNTDTSTRTILPQAVFDSTTNFFWGDNNLIQRITQTLEGLTPSKCQLEPQTGIYDCECSKDASEYPPIYFTFENQTREFSLSGKDYIHIYKEQYEPGLRNCILLFRTALKYDSANAAAKPVPATDNKLYFPTSFLKAHYTVFDQSDNTISIAPAFQVSTQKTVLNATDRYIFITLASLAFVATIIAILSLIPKIPYVPAVALQQLPVNNNVSTTTFIPVQQPAQQIIVQTPPKNYILSSLPIQAQPGTTIQQSPIRQSYTRPYQGYITGQNF